jgi:aryl-alcohol dehydrogenase (NADP+)
VAARHASTPAQVALAWQLGMPGITAPIASATSLDQLHDLVSAVALKLDEADMDRLCQASAVAA